MQGGSEEGWSFAYTATAAFDGLHANLQRMALAPAQAQGGKDQALAHFFLMNNVHHVLTA